MGLQSGEYTTCTQDRVGDVNHNWSIARREQGVVPTWSDRHIQDWAQRISGRSARCFETCMLGLKGKEEKAVGNCCKSLEQGPSRARKVWNKQVYAIGQGAGKNNSWKVVHLFSCKKLHPQWTSAGCYSYDGLFDQLD